MPSPGLIYQVVERHRRELLRMERQAASEMVRVYGASWARISDSLGNLIRQIDDLRREGEDVAVSWLFQQRRLAALQEQVEAELARFSEYADPQIRNSQWQAVNSAERHIREQLDTYRVDYGFMRLPTEAVEDLVGFLGNGSPLRSLLDEMGPTVSAGFRQALIDGVALGENPREVARRVRREYATGLSRTLRIARTETLRSYREATKRNYEANEDIIEGWVWVAAHQPRTCPMCLAMDGTVHPLSETLDDHPNGRCTAIPKLRNVPLPQTKTGAEWLEEQDEETQRRVLGSAGYEAYQGGAVKLADFVGQRSSREWGTTRYARSLKDILGAEGALGWRQKAL